MKNKNEEVGSDPVTYISLSESGVGYSLIHKGSPLTDSNRSVDQCLSVAKRHGLTITHVYEGGLFTKFVKEGVAMNTTTEIERAVRKAMTHLEDAYHHIMNAETLTQPQKDLLFNILADASKVLKSSQEVSK